jgi:hypothetical protein
LIIPLAARLIEIFCVRSSSFFNVSSFFSAARACATSPQAERDDFWTVIKKIMKLFPFSGAGRRKLFSDRGREKCAPPLSTEFTFYIRVLCIYHFYQPHALLVTRRPRLDKFPIAIPAT